MKKGTRVKIRSLPAIADKKRFKVGELATVMEEFPMYPQHVTIQTDAGEWRRMEIKDLEEVKQ